MRDDEHRNYGITPFRRIWQKQRHLPGLSVDELMLQAEKLVQVSCRDETSAIDLCNRLKEEVKQQEPLTSKHVAEILWTSCQVDTEGRAFSSFLQEATRYSLVTLCEDAVKARHAASIAICLNLHSESDYSLKMHSSQPHQSFDAIAAVEDASSPGGLWYQNIKKKKNPCASHQYPIGGRCYRGSSMPRNHKKFFDEAKGKQVCMPNYFATSVDKGSTDRYLANAASLGLEPVLWEVSFDKRADPNGANNTDYDVNEGHHYRYVEHRAPEAPSEKEFLFVPYAAFTIVEITWQEHSTASQPHVISIEVCDVGEEMLDDMPVAPWS